MIKPTMNRNLTRGYVIALICAVFLSTTAIFIRYLTVNYQIPAMVLALWRDVFVIVTLLPVMGIFWPGYLKLESRYIPYFIGYGLMLSVFNALWTLSVAFNGAAVATVLAYCSAAFTAILGWWLLKEPLDWAKLLAVAFSLGGCVLVSGALDSKVWHTNLLGIVTGIFSGLSYAGYSLMGRSAAQRGLNPWTTLFYTFSFATVFLLLANLLPGLNIPGIASSPAEIFWLKDAYFGWVVLFTLAAVPTVLGFGLYNVSLSMLPASVANLIATTEPVFTAVVAYALLGERLSGEQLVGGAMILGGVVLLRVWENVKLRIKS
jgi:drug/metabolite transporter (DMT)-like permease